jgi:hypothetical protein
VVDHELDGELRVDLRGVAAEVGHRVPHRREVHDGGHTGEVLEEHAGGHEGDLPRGLRSRHPARDGLDVVGRHGHAVLVPQHVLEQDAQRVRQPVDVVPILQRADPEHLEVAPSDREGAARAEAVRMGHLPRFKQLRDAALRERGLPRVEVARDRARVRLADAPGVAREALVAHRPQILGVRLEDVLAADLPRGVEERQPHADGHLEQAPLLAIRLVDERGVDLIELVRAREVGCIAAEVGERLPQRLHLERREIDEARSGPARAFERREQVVDGAELGVAPEHACVLQLAHEHVEVDARPVGDVRGRGEQPERGEAEREDRPQLDDVPRSLAHSELSR